MLKSIIKLISGNGFAQLIQLLVIPFLTLYYSSNDFGLFAIIIAVSGIISTAITFQFNVSLINLKKIFLAKRIINLIQIINLILFIISLIIMSLLVYFTHVINFNLIYFLALPIIFLTSINNVLKSYFILSEKYNIVIRSLLIRSVFIVFIQLFLGEKNISAGLILGLLAGEIISYIFLFYCLKYRSPPLISINKIIFFYKKTKDFIVFGTLQELTSILVFWCPFLLVSYSFSQNISGQFSISYRIIWPLTILITSAVSQILYREFSFDHAKIRTNIVYNWKYKLLCLSLAIIGAIISPPIFHLILNKQWDIAPILSINTIFICIVFFYAMPYRIIYRVYKKQKILLKIELFYLIFMLPLFFYSFESPENLLYYITVVQFIVALTIEYNAKKIITYQSTI